MSFQAWEYSRATPSGSIGARRSLSSCGKGFRIGYAANTVPSRISWVQKYIGLRRSLLILNPPAERVGPPFFQNRLARSPVPRPHASAMNPPTQALIRTIRRYQGRGHPWAIGLRVVVAQVHRDDRILRDDAEIGHVLPSDLIEFAPLLVDPDGV